MKILRRYADRAGSCSFVIEAPWASGEILETILLTVFDIPTSRETGAFVSFGSELPPDGFLGAVMEVVGKERFAKEHLVTMSRDAMSVYWPTHPETLSVAPTPSAAITQAIDKARALRAKVPHRVKESLRLQPGHPETLTIRGYNHPVFLAIGCNSDKYLSGVARSISAEQITDKQVTVSFQLPTSVRAWLELDSTGIYAQTIDVI
jgi:hypothetical protein